MPPTATRWRQARIRRRGRGADRWARADTASSCGAASASASRPPSTEWPSKPVPARLCSSATSATRRTCTGCWTGCATSGSNWSRWSRSPLARLIPGLSAARRGVPEGKGEADGDRVTRLREKALRPTSSVFRAAGRLPGDVGLPAAVSREEMRLRLLKLLAVEEELDLLVVKGDHPGDGRQLTGGKVIRPREVRVHRATSPDRPVAARDALVRAICDRVGG